MCKYKYAIFVFVFLWLICIFVSREFCLEQILFLSQYFILFYFINFIFNLWRFMKNKKKSSINEIHRFYDCASWWIITKVIKFLEILIYLNVIRKPIDCNR